MKNKFVKIASVAFLLSGLVFVGCQSQDSKLENAKEDVKESKQELKEVQQEANAENQKAASAEEWKLFKEETDLKIKKNEARIAELNAKMKSSGKTMDSYYQQRIDKLEQSNKDMSTRLTAYENNQSDWESFKREFNHDMDELGQALNDFSVDNKK